MKKVALAGGVLALSLMGLATNAYAGPCSDDIATLSRQIGQMPGLGAPLSEPSAGNVGAKSTETASAAVPKASDRAQAGGASREGGGSPGTVAGAAGSGVGSGAAVASGQVATSDQDVRAQSVGKPSAAQQAATNTGGATTTAKDDRVSEAKMSLQKAVDLNAQGDSSCASAVSKTRELMKAGQ